jgi:uncharacterized protein (TIGR02453 family)
MQYFTKDFIDFFQELEVNNNKAWFDVHRNRYESQIKKPFEAFVQNILNEVKLHESENTQLPKDCIFRINRDIRFSTDKSPYKLNRSAFFSKYGKKSGNMPGFYVELSATKVLLGGGCYEPDKEGLFAIRQELVYNTDAFKQCLNDPLFHTYYPAGLQGPKNKTLQADFSADAERIPELYLKSFFFMAELPASAILKSDFAEVVKAHYKAALPFNAFFETALLH